MAIQGKRLLYIDNLRIFLVILVVLSHVAITYGPIGFWYYYERTGLFSTYFLAFFVSLMQSFLIGLFFMISAFFIPPALNKKGPEGFLKDRLKRLGIPIVFYIFVITPVIIYLNELVINGKEFNFFIFYYEKIIKGTVIDVGPLWFLEILLFFSISYLVFSRLIRNLFKNKKRIKFRFPSNKNILFTILVLSIVNFIVRIKFPINAITRQINIGLAPQYIFLFCLGIIAYKNNWFELITLKKFRFWFSIAVVTIIFWPFFLFIDSSTGLNIEIFAGGLKWQSLVYSTWEATLSISLSICIIYLFQKRLNHQSKFIKKLSKSSYTVFIIHALIIVMLSYAFKDFMLHPMIKFILTSLIGIILCFAFSFYIIKLPFIRKIL